MRNKAVQSSCVDDHLQQWGLLCTLLLAFKLGKLDYRLHEKRH